MTYLRLVKAATSAGLISLFLCSSAAAANPCDGFADLVARVSKVRELEPLHPLTCRVVPDDELRRNDYLIRSFAAVQRTLPYDEQIFKMLGLIPENYPYRDCVIDSGPAVPELLYDPESSAVLIREGSSNDDEAVAAEIVRALLDQHFKTREAEVQARESTDKTLAALAAINGDALNSAGRVPNLRPGEASPEPRLRIRSECVPPETLLFISEFSQQFGVLYINQLREKGGNKLVDELLAPPPGTTKEILYKLPARTKLEPSAFPDIPLPQPSPRLKSSGFTLKQTEHLGEYMIRTLLRNYLGSAPALSAARGWTGDTLAFYRNPKDDTLIMWDTRWATEEDAKEFFQAFRVLLYLRFRVDATRSLESFIFQSAAGDRFEASRKKTEVLISILRPEEKTS